MMKRDSGQLEMLHRALSFDHDDSSRQRRSYFETDVTRRAGPLDAIIALQRGAIGSRIQLVASACYPFDSVLRALAEPSFVLPAEGLPGARYLPGSGVMDLVEEIGEELVLDLFGRPSGYCSTVQPHSSTQANQIVYNAVLRPDDCVLCLRPRDGGHVSHSVPLARRHRTFSYGLTSDGLIDYEQMRALALRHRPRLIIVGGTALPRAIDFETCGDIARTVGAFLHADISHTAAFIAADVHTRAFPYCDFATFNLMKNLRGPNGGILVYRSRLRTQVHRALFPITQGGPNETNVLGKIACLLEWSERDLALHARSILSRATALAEELRKRDVCLVTGGTDCHMLLIDLRTTRFSGAALEQKLELLGVLANRNLIPGDTRPPTEASGLRLGATNLSILNYDEADIELLASWLADVVQEKACSASVIEHLVGKYQSHLIAPMW